MYRSLLAYETNRQCVDLYVLATRMQRWRRRRWLERRVLSTSGGGGTGCYWKPTGGVQPPPLHPPPSIVKPSPGSNCRQKQTEIQASQPAFCQSMSFGSVCQAWSKDAIVLYERQHVAIVECQIQNATLTRRKGTRFLTFKKQFSRKKVVMGLKSRRSELFKFHFSKNHKNLLICTTSNIKHQTYIIRVHN